MRNLLACLLLVLSTPVHAENWLEQIRKADLNDYALGLALSGTQNPYRGADDSAFFYPYLTSFEDSSMTDDWLLVREGDIGARMVTEKEWEFGLLGRVQTLGLGNSDDAEQRQLRDRNWTLEAGPMIGYRGWPLHLNFKSYYEVSGRHNGLTYDLSLTWPIRFRNGYLVPGVDFVYANAEYNDYYFDVHADEVLDNRTLYSTGASVSKLLKIRWGYALTDRWLLSGNVQWKKFDQAIKDSPIVGRSSVLSANIGLAYNANLFRPREIGSRPPKRFELRIGAFRDSIESSIRYGDPSGVAGTEVDIEQELQVPDKDTVLHIEGIYRLGHFHRLEFGYLKLERDGVGTLSQPVRFGGSDYQAGTRVDSEFTNEIARVSYGYSLIHDDQKEFGVSAGLHLAGIEAQLTSLTTGATQKADSSTPLPVVGAFGSVNLNAQLTIGAKAQFFRMNFDRYKGSVNTVTVYGERTLGANFLIGVAYNYFSMNLSSSDNDLAGRIQAKHTGPALYFSLRL